MGTILVIDDEPRIRELLRVALSSQGYKVVLAANGNQALLAMGVSQPDLILSDVAMPEMDGVGFLDILHRTPEWKHIPVILLTGFATPEQQETARVLGATEQLTKASFSIRELRAKVAEYMAVAATPQPKVA
jgi:two-component system, OmpR family, KDP operon response regulator KdpE